METRDFKYLLAYTLPLSGIIGINLAGYYSFMTVIIAYLIIPIIDGLIPRSRENLDIDLARKKSLNSYFDSILLVNLPLVYIVLFLFLNKVSSGLLSNFELVGLVITTAIVFTTSGINVAHELGHKPERYNKIVAQLLLLPSMYMHFFIEHNRGHHLNVSTKEDPASARKGEMFYVFWFRSVIGQWIDSWKLEYKRLKKIDLLHNQMFHFTVIQLLFLGVIFYVFGSTVMLLFLATAILSFTQLELVNYIEHYGLERKMTSSGRYEKVSSIHSWNSNHEVGRIMLYELTRHSDHHYKSAKKFQILDHHDNSPQLPFGYPTSMLISLVPPLWFKLMDGRVPG